MSETGAVTYHSECPENHCPTSFVGARPQEVLQHILDEHGAAKAHYYWEMDDTFASVSEAFWGYE